MAGNTATQANATRALDDGRHPPAGPGATGELGPRGGRPHASPPARVDTCQSKHGDD